MRLSHHVARFWLRPGVLWPVQIAVPYPPPGVYEVHVSAPLQVAWRAEELTPVFFEPPHTVRFRLTDYSRTGEVCHYQLVPEGRPGWRYIFDGPRILAERVGVVIRPDPRVPRNEVQLRGHDGKVLGRITNLGPG